MLTASYNQQDEKIVRSIFGPKENLKAYLKVIEKETDKFRPLNYFLKGKTTDPDERVIDLLGWLIGFPPRPVLTGYNVSTVKKEEQEIPEDEKQKEKTVEPDKVEKERVEKKLTKKLVSVRKIGILLTVLVFACVSAYWLLQNPTKSVSPKTSLITRKGKYMYWTGDHYLAIPAYQAHGDTPVIPLDPQVLNHLKKITDTNSINYSSIGKVWYARLHKNNYEYFTDSGFHPIDTVIRLRPMTKFIIDKHLPNHK
jgi:hypothetical protein